MVHRSAEQLLVVGLVFGLAFSTAAVVGADRSDGPHWAFLPPARPLPPRPARPERASSPIDWFVEAKLAERGLIGLPPAEPSTLLRRATLDLIGLPPTLDELLDLERRTAAGEPDALDRHIDRLLASPRYGERWARPWLDLCHYADTDGYLTDQARPVAWRYRQWLVDALNADLPYADFTLQQLAGDLLPDATLDTRLATGFLRNTLSNREGGADLEEFRVEQVVDRVQMVGSAWLGLTVGCARCHDHKFDPLSQREFFELYALLDGADEVNVDAPLDAADVARAAARGERAKRRAELLEPFAGGLAELQARWERRLLEAAERPGVDPFWDRQWEVLGLIWGGQLGEGQLEGVQIVRTPVERRTEDERERLTDYFLQRGDAIDPARFKELKLGELTARLQELDARFPRPSRAPAMRESPVERPVFVHERGDFRTPGERVTGGVPSCLPGWIEGQPRNRLGLARWLVRDDHPLTWRTAANRAWQELFGRGLAATADDFGLQGEPPSHPELLDWLAWRLREAGGSQKTLHRTLLGSAAYRRATARTPADVEADPDGVWLARQRSLRLSADQIRDATLAVSGLLDDRVGGPAVFPPQPASVTAEAFENAWPTSRGGDRYRRGLYVYLQRLSPFAQLVTFDAPSLGRVCVRRERSNSPLQALQLLNDPVSIDAAAALAAQLLTAERRGELKAATDAEPDDAGRPAAEERRADWLYRRTLGRAPSDEERRRLATFVVEQIEVARRSPDSIRWLPEPLDPASTSADGKSADEPAAGAWGLARVGGASREERAAWTLAASVLLNLHEFVTRP